MSLLADNVLILEGGRIERSADEYRAHHLQADMQFSSAVTTRRLSIMFVCMVIQLSPFQEVTLLETIKVEILIGQAMKRSF